MDRCIGGYVDIWLDGYLVRYGRMEETQKERKENNRLHLFEIFQKKDSNIPVLKFL